MLSTTAYVLKAQGEFDVAWMRDCFRLFKERQVNIRKFLLLRKGNADAASMLEIQFVLAENNPASEAFLQALDERTRQVRWQSRQLGPVT